MTRPPDRFHGIQKNISIVAPIPANVVADVEGSNAFFLNLWTSSFFTNTLRIYENFVSDTDFQYLEIRPTDGGPYIIATVGSSGVRSLNINATDQMTLISGTQMLLQTSSNSPLIFGTNNTQYWKVDEYSGDLVPMQDSANNLGEGNSARVNNIYTRNLATGGIFTIDSGDLVIGNNDGTIFWKITNGGIFTPDGGNGNPDIGSANNPTRQVFMTKGLVEDLTTSPDLESFTNMATLGFEVIGPGLCRLIVLTNSGPVTVVDNIPFE